MGVTVFLHLPGFQELVKVKEPLARKSRYLQGRVCVEGREGHFSELVVPSMSCSSGVGDLEGENWATQPGSSAGPGKFP